MTSRRTTAEELREIVRAEIAPSIDVHRDSRTSTEGSNYARPDGAPSDDEVSDFLVSNVLLDEETTEQLLDPGFLGFSAKGALVSDGWLAGFRTKLRDWAANDSWLGADAPLRWPPTQEEPEKSVLWHPSKSPQPSWVAASPSALMLAEELMANGRLLSELSWKQFEDLIAELLVREAWSISGLVRTRDGGVDVTASKEDDTLGFVRALWQAKKYGHGTKVGLHHVRELSGVLDRSRATKGIIVTTSSLTKGALSWVRQDCYRLGYKDGELMEHWIAGAKGKPRE